MPNVRKTKKSIRRPRRNTRSTVRSVPRSINTIVSKAINRQLETKMASTTLNVTGFNSSISTLADFNQLLPSISQGSVSQARVGNNITPIKLVIRGHILYRADTNLGARMIGTRLFAFSDKSVKTYPTALAAGVNFSLLDLGGSAIPYSGTALNYHSPHNSDLFNFYADKKHAILKPYGYTNTFSPGVTNDLTAMDKSMYKPFTITIKASQMPKVLKYDDTVSSGFPINFAPWLAVGYSDLLGYTPDTTQTQILMEFVSTLYYKDA